LREIRHFQKSAGLIIPHAPFTRVVQEVAQETRPLDMPFRWQLSAVKALQEAAEAYLAAFFESQCNLA
jgi:histone H3/H4